MAENNSTTVKFSKDKHARNILVALNSSRHNTHLCDGLVVIGQDRINIQKAVLSAASHYFRLNFSYEGVDGNIRSEVDLTSLNIRKETFEMILDYIYTSEIQLSEENIQDILQAADVLLLGELKDICCEYLEGCISPDNCLGIMDFASRFTCPWLHFKVTQYVDENFRYIFKTEEFMKLDEKALTNLLSRPTLEASETMVLESICLWYEFNKTERGDKVNDILELSINGMDLSKDTLRGSTVAEKFSEVTKRLETENVVPRGSTEVILVAGGIGRHMEPIKLVRYVNPHDFCYQQKPHTKMRWKDLAPMNSLRSNHGLVECGGCVYAVGGSNDKDEVLRTGEKYDPVANTWIPIASMEQGRAEFGLVAINDNIYAVGGRTDENCPPLTSLEVYNIFSNKWRKLPDMNIERRWFSCVALNKTIFLIGGGHPLKPFESVECFDTETETWYSVSPLLEKRYCGKAVAKDDEIFVFGGTRRIECPSAGGQMKFCGNEVYSSSSDTWAPIPQRQGLEGCLCVNPELSRLDCALSVEVFFYVLGNLQVGDQFVNAIRGYDRQTNTWFTAVPNFPDDQLSITGCVVKIPNYILNKEKSQDCVMKT